MAATIIRRMNELCDADIEMKKMVVIGWLKKSELFEPIIDQLEMCGGGRRRAVCFVSSFFPSFFRMSAAPNVSDNATESIRNSTFSMWICRRFSKARKQFETPSNNHDSTVRIRHPPDWMTYFPSRNQTTSFVRQVNNFLQNIIISLSFMEQQERLNCGCNGGFTSSLNKWRALTHLIFTTLVLLNEIRCLICLFSI